MLQNKSVRALFVNEQMIISKCLLFVADQPEKIAVCGSNFPLLASRILAVEGGSLLCGASLDVLQSARRTGRTGKTGLLWIFTERPLISESNPAGS